MGGLLLMVAGHAQVFHYDHPNNFIDFEDFNLIRTPTVMADFGNRVSLGSVDVLNGGGDHRNLIMKTAPNGAVVWATELEVTPGGGPDKHGDLVNVQDKFAFCGQHYESPGVQRGFVTLMDANGDALWSVMPTGALNLHGLVHVPGQQRIVAYGDAQAAPYAVALNYQGKVLSARHYTTHAGLSTFVSAARGVGSNPNIYALSTSGSSAEFSISQFAADGTTHIQTWYYDILGVSLIHVRQIIADAHGNLYVSAIRPASGPVHQLGMVFKIAPFGGIAAARQYNVPYLADLGGMSIANGKLYLAGTMVDENANLHAAFGCVAELSMADLSVQNWIKITEVTGEQFRNQFHDVTTNSFGFGPESILLTGETHDRFGAQALTILRMDANLEGACASVEMQVDEVALTVSVGGLLASSVNYTGWTPFAYPEISHPMLVGSCAGIPKAAATMETAGQQEMRIYPNPVRERLYIKGVDPQSVVRARIVDQQGRRVPAAMAATRGIVDTRLLSPGIYVLELQLEKGEIQRRKFVRQ